MLVWASARPSALGDVTIGACELLWWIASPSSPVPSGAAIPHVRRLSGLWVCRQRIGQVAVMAAVLPSSLWVPRLQCHRWPSG
jgi:hypothetical protein